MGLSSLENLQVKRQNVGLSASKDLVASSAIPIYLFKNLRKQAAVCVVKKLENTFFPKHFCKSAPRQ